MNEKFINTPFLFLYKSQYSSIFSIFLRISGYVLLIWSLLILLNLNEIFFTFNSLSLIFEIFTSFSYYISYIIFFGITFFLAYHLFLGVKYIFSINIFNVEEFQSFLDIKNYYLIGYGLLIFIVIIYILFFFI